MRLIVGGADVQRRQGRREELPRLDLLEAADPRAGTRRAAARDGVAGEPRDCDGLCVAGPRQPPCLAAENAPRLRSREGNRGSLHSPATAVAAGSRSFREYLASPSNLLLVLVPQIPQTDGGVVTAGDQRLRAAIEDQRGDRAGVADQPLPLLTRGQVPEMNHVAAAGRGQRLGAAEAERQHFAGGPPGQIAATAACRVGTRPRLIRTTSVAGRPRPGAFRRANSRAQIRRVEAGTSASGLSLWLSQMRTTPLRPAAAIRVPSGEKAMARMSLPGAASSRIDRPCWLSKTQTLSAKPAAANVRPSGL